MEDQYYIGMTNVNKLGYKMTILNTYLAKVNNKTRRYVDVQFEDGSINYRKAYTAFKNGKIGHPNIHDCRKKEFRKGETVISNCGMKMTIIDYIDSLNLTIQFEDGTIVKGVRYSRFKKGEVGKPNDRHSNNFHTRINEINKHKCGQTIKIIRYDGFRDMDVQFEDGTIVKNTNYRSFKNGTVRHDIVDKDNIVNEISINQGMIMKIIGCNNKHSISIEFEDGTTVENKNYTHFINGQIRYPKFTRIQLAYLYKDTKYFHCYCKKCGFKDILPIYKLKEHNCNIN